MPSTHNFTAAELPCSHPAGLDWIKAKLESVGRNMVVVTATADPSVFTVQIGEANVSKNQLTFDMQPVDGQLAANMISVNVPPMTTTSVTITGAIGKLIKVRFPGVSFVSETEFTIPANSNYEYTLGPCPSGQRVVTPQMFEFYVEDGSCSPTTVMVTFT